MTLFPSPIISTAWLAEHLHAVKPVDASWHMPAARRDAQAEYAAAHVPKAVFFDIDAHSDRHSNLPHMLPTPGAFALAVSGLGISNNDAVVVYDSNGLFSAARLWWMFRIFGHDNVAVLDGGLPKWLAEGRPTETGFITPPSADFHAGYRSHLLRGKGDVLGNLATKKAVVMDARGADRFYGTVPEPRAGLRSGHIPASQHVHYASLLNADATLKPREELEVLLSAAENRPVITSCGSGVTACILDLALEHIGHRDHAVYDGSWAEWGGDEACPVEQG